MRKLAACVIVATIALMIASLPSTDQAQQAVAIPSGEALQAKAEKVRDSLLKGTPEEFMGLLAPWIQGRIKLRHAEMRPEFMKREAEHRAEFEENWLKTGTSPKGPDPSDMLKIKTIDDFLNLTPAKLNALFFGYYRIRGGAVTEEKLASEWFLVDRAIGFEQVQEKSKSTGGGSWISRTRGRVTFMNAVHRDGFAVTCVAEGDNWHVVDVEYRLGSEESVLDKYFGDSEWRRFGPVSSSTRDARRSEGEQILGSMKGQVRVAYAKLGGHAGINKLTGAIGKGGCGVVASELAGKYFKMRDKVASTDASAKLMCEPTLDDSKDGFCVFEFKWGGGDGTYIWYDTLDDLHAAHPEFK